MEEAMSISTQVLIQEPDNLRRSDNIKQEQPFSDANNAIPQATTISHGFADGEETFERTSDSSRTMDCEDDKLENVVGSYWDIVATLYMPLILLWSRRSMFGPANLIRSVIVGQLMRIIVLDDVSKWICERLPSWLEIYLIQPSMEARCMNSHVSTVLGAVSGKPDPHAWPPPAFTGLAMLTVFALVVHPDGLTWIMLGKLRDAIYAIFSALGRSLEFVINDYGVFPTIIASATLAGLFFVVFVVLRTLSPKKGNNHSNNNQNNKQTNERKKKKKKGGNGRHRREHQHHHHNHRLNRIKYSSQLPSPSLPEVVEDSSTREVLKDSSTPELLNDSSTQEVLEDSKTTAASMPSLMPSTPPSVIHNDESTESPSPLNDAKGTELRLPALPSPSTTNATNVSSDENNMKPTSVTENFSSPAATNKSKDKRSRRRMMSGSTEDTIPMSDDQSCGSTSVRSYPSVSVNSNRPGGRAGHNNKGSGSTSRRGKRGETERPKHAERGNRRKNKGPSAESSVSSRWDALKPKHGNNSNSVGNSKTSYNHNHSSNGGAGNKKQSRYQKGNGRRGPGGSGNGSKNRKSRPTPKTFANNERPSAAASSANNPGARVHEAPPLASARQNTGFQSPTTMTAFSSNPVLNSYTASPQSNKAPTPPPGFQTGQVLSGLEDNKYEARHRYNDDLSVPTLFDTPPLVLKPPKAAIGPPPRPQYNEVVGAECYFPGLVPSHGGSANGGTTRSRIKENPFSNDSNNNLSFSRYEENLDSQIEADLQKLGGQMAGSILDF